MSALRRVEDGSKSRISPSTSVGFGDGMAVIDVISVSWKPSDLAVFPENARPVVGEAVMEKLGEERSLVRSVGQTSQSGSTITGESATPTSSRSEGRMLSVKNVMLLCIVGFACLIT